MLPLSVSIRIATQLLYNIFNSSAIMLCFSFNMFSQFSVAGLVKRWLFILSIVGMTSCFHSKTML